MFAGFRCDRIDAAEMAINFQIGDAGQPVLLLHRYPRTHAMWHHSAPKLAQDFTVVWTDLRAYGHRQKPPI